MLTDVIGRVRNISLAASKPLLPLYEAIVNSIQAIEDADVDGGRIDITVCRDQNHLLANVDKSSGEIESFSVKDNGIGFTEPNYDAFQTSDTTYKARRGGKGIGRFLWLVAFEEVKIESHFVSQDKGMLRRFSFVPLGDGIKDTSVTPSSRPHRETTVTLLKYKEKYRRQCPRRLDRSSPPLAGNW